MLPIFELNQLFENDPEICDMNSRQTLQPVGNHVILISDTSKAIHKVIKFTPDLIISDVNLSGISGKDPRVALKSQGLRMPLIVIAEKGQENEGIQAIGLGAADHLQPNPYPIQFSLSGGKAQLTIEQRQVVIGIKELFQHVLNSIKSICQPLENIWKGGVEQCLHLT